MATIDSTGTAASRGPRLQRTDANEVRFSLVAFVLGTLVLAAALPILLVTTIDDVHRSDAWPLTLGIFIWSGLRIAWLIGTGRPRLFEFAWWLYVYVFMGLAPTVQIRSGLFPGTTPGTDPDLDSATAWVVAIGIVAFELGAWFARLRNRNRPSQHERRFIAVSGRKGVLVTIIGIALSVYLISRIGLGNLFLSRSSSAAARTEAFTSGSVLTIVNSLAIWGTLIGIHTLTWARRARKALGLRPHHGVLILVALLVLLIFKNPISSARYTFGVIAVSLIVLLGAFATAPRVRASMAGIMVALFGIFPIADAFRRDTVTISRGGFFDEYGATADYDSFAQISNTIAYVNEHGVAVGQQLLGVVLFWVPREVWPGKAIDTGALLANYRGYRFTNLSAPTWAELYINGGMILLVIGMILIGFGFIQLDRQLESVFRAGGLWAIAGAILPFYMLLVLRGSLLQAASTIAVMVVLIWFVKDRSRAAPELKTPSRGRSGRGTDRT